MSIASSKQLAGLLRAVEASGKMDRSELLVNFRAMVFENEEWALGPIIEFYFNANLRLPPVARPCGLGDSITRKKHEFVGHINRTIERRVETVLDTYRLISGALLGDVQWFELDRLAAASERDAKIIRSIQRHLRVNDTSLRVRDVLKPSDLERILQQVDDEAVAA